MIHSPWRSPSLLANASQRESGDHARPAGSSTPWMIARALVMSAAATKRAHGASSRDWPLKPMTAVDAKNAGCVHRVTRPEGRRCRCRPTIRGWMEVPEIERLAAVGDCECQRMGPRLIDAHDALADRASTPQEPFAVVGSECSLPRDEWHVDQRHQWCRATARVYGQERRLLAERTSAARRTAELEGQSSVCKGERGQCFRSRCTALPCRSPRVLLRSRLVERSKGASLRRSRLRVHGIRTRSGRPLTRRCHPGTRPRREPLSMAPMVPRKTVMGRLVGIQRRSVLPPKLEDCSAPRLPGSPLIHVTTT